MNRTIVRELLVLSYPMVVSQGAFALMLFTDRYFMSLISPTHMGASLGGGVASFFCISFFFGALSYTNALTAQYYGKRELAKCPLAMTQGMLMTLAFAPLLLVVSLLVAELFVLMGHEAEQARLEKEYFLVLMSGSLFSLAKTCISSYFTGIGRTTIVMIGDILGVAVNIPLSYVLIFGVGFMPELGITGAALGTIFATLFTIGIFLFFFFMKDHWERFHVRDSFRLDMGILRRFVRLGFPSGVEMFLNVAAFNLFLLMFQSYGVVESASAAIVFNWDIVSFVPMLGLNFAIISLVGRYVGAGDPARMYHVARAAFVFGLGYSGFLALVFAGIPELLVGMFLAPEEAAEFMDLASFMMVGLSCYVMADAIILITGGVLRGAGDTRWLMWASIIIHWVMLGVQYLVIEVWDMGAKVSWVIFVIMILMTAAIYMWRLSSKAWRTEEAFRRVMSEH